MGQRFLRDGLVQFGTPAGHQDRTEIRPLVRNGLGIVAGQITLLAGAAGRVGADEPDRAGVSAPSVPPNPK